MSVWVVALAICFVNYDRNTVAEALQVEVQKHEVYVERSSLLSDNI